MGICIIAPAINTCVWNIQREEITELVDTIHNPSIFSVPMESVNGDNTTITP